METGRLKKLDKHTNFIILVININGTILTLVSVLGIKYFRYNFDVFFFDIFFLLKINSIFCLTCCVELDVSIFRRFDV